MWYKGGGGGLFNYYSTNIYIERLKRDLIYLYFNIHTKFKSIVFTS